MTFGVCDFSRLAVTYWRLRRWRLWFLALMTAALFWKCQNFHFSCFAHRRQVKGSYDFEIRPLQPFKFRNPSNYASSDLTLSLFIWSNLTFPYLANKWSELQIAWIWLHGPFETRAYWDSRFPGKMWHVGWRGTRNGIFCILCFIIRILNSEWGTCSRVKTQNLERKK